MQANTCGAKSLLPFVLNTIHSTLQRECTRWGEGGLWKAVFFPLLKSLLPCSSISLLVRSPLETEQSTSSKVIISDSPDCANDKQISCFHEWYNTPPLSSNIILYEWKGGGVLYSLLTIYYFMLSITPYSMPFQLFRGLIINRRDVSSLNPPPLKLERKTEKSQKGPNEITLNFLFPNSGLKLWQNHRHISQGGLSPPPW